MTDWTNSCCAVFGWWAMQRAFEVAGALLACMPGVDWMAPPVASSPLRLCSPVTALPALLYRSADGYVFPAARPRLLTSLSHC